MRSVLEQKPAAETKDSIGARALYGAGAGGP
jgi:hypothetical protein